MILTGISFPDNLGDDIVLKITDTATRQVWYFPFMEGVDDIDISAMYPLMQHWYKWEFSVSGVPINFTITNPDGTTVVGCCIEVLPNEGYSQDSAEFAISTTTCVV